MDIEPRDPTNPFSKENIMETIIEKSPSEKYTKVLKQYLLMPQWPDYQEETFEGTTVNKRELSLRQGKIENVTLTRTSNKIKIIFTQGAEGNFVILFNFVLPDNHTMVILQANADNSGRATSMLVHALPRRPFHTQEQTQDKNPDRLENPTIDVGEKTISIRDVAKSFGIENLDDVKWVNPLVAEFKDLGPTEFKCHVLRSEPKQEPLSISYNKEFPLMERQFRLEKKSGLFILHQQSLTPPFFKCTTTFPDAIPTETVRDKLRGTGKGWRNFFDETQINVEFSQTP